MPQDKNRIRIAMTIVTIGTLGLIVVSWVLIRTAGPDDKLEAGRLVFAGVLPLLGSWVGTVLAFYFSEKSHEAASRSAKDLTQGATELALASRQDSLQSMLAHEAMLAISSIEKVTIDPPDPNAIKVKPIGDSEKSRTPILDAVGKPRGILHRSEANRFLVGKPNAETVTLADMFADPKTKELIESSFATVRRSDTLATVAQAMESIENCQDAFVTEDGTRDTKVLGWIMNVDIERRVTRMLF